MSDQVSVDSLKPGQGSAVRFDVGPIDPILVYIVL